MNAVTSLFAFNDNTKSQQQSQVARSALLLARRLGKISVRINYTVSHQAIMCEFFLPNLAGLVTLQLSWLGGLHRARLQKKKKKREKIAVLTNGGARRTRSAAVPHIQRNSTGWSTTVHHQFSPQSSCFYDRREAKIIADTQIYFIIQPSL